MRFLRFYFAARRLRLLGDTADSSRNDMGQRVSGDRTATRASTRPNASLAQHCHLLTIAAPRGDHMTKDVYMTPSDDEILCWYPH